MKESVCVTGEILDGSEWDAAYSVIAWMSG